jgi:hypothetical protein
MILSRAGRDRYPITQAYFPDQDNPLGGKERGTLFVPMDRWHPQLSRSLPSGRESRRAPDLDRDLYYFFFFISVSNSI